MSEFTNRLLLHHEFWKNPSDFGGVKDVDRESLVADLEEAANTIESLQRENEELKANTIRRDAFPAEEIKIAIYEEFAEPEDQAAYAVRVLQNIISILEQEDEE